MHNIYCFMEDNLLYESNIYQWQKNSKQEMTTGYGYTDYNYYQINKLNEK